MVYTIIPIRGRVVGSKIAYIGALMPALSCLLIRYSITAPTSILYRLTPLYYILLFIGVMMWVYGIARSKSPRKTGALSFGLFILGAILAFLI